MDNSQYGPGPYEISYDFSDLNECQIKQCQSLMQNLSKIKKDQLQYFPQNITLFHKDDNYKIRFEEINFSQIKNSQLMQEWRQPIHYGKRLLKLLVGLQKYNIYLPTLSQDSFTRSQQESMLSNQISNKKQVVSYILIEFGLEKLENISANLQDYHCLSPEFINQIKNPLINTEQIVFTEKMSIFNVGCMLFEFITLGKLYEYQNNFEDTINSNLWNSIFNGGLNYQNYLFGLLIQKCVLLEELESYRRPTFQEALSELEYIGECEQIIKRAQQQMKSISIHEFFSFDSNLQEQLNQVMQYKICHQITGRLFILQNLARIKFIYIIFQKKQHMYFREFLMMKLIIKEIQQVQKLQQEPQNIQQIDLNFKDSVDEIREFKQIYSQKYIDLLYQLIKSIQENRSQINLEQEKTYFQEECKLSNQQDFSNYFHSNLIQDNTIQSKLHKICLENILTVFDFHQLNLNFKPIFLKLTKQDHYQNIYDKLLQFLFDKDGDQTQFEQVIQAIQTNLIS